ncbi:MAG: cytochrome c, partial [Acidobacteria bacterium]|nr:cytochrome c [Acidobacteriota bacterium]
MMTEYTRRTAKLLLVAGAAMALGACSNFPSRQPPIWIFPDMKRQDKYKAQMSAPFFADGRTSRRPVEGTVAQEWYKADEAFSTGVTADGNYVAKNPLTLDKATLERGQVKFNVYCAPCHDRTGGGRGTVVQRGFPPPVDLASDRVRSFADGEIFN